MARSRIGPAPVVGFATGSDVRHWPPVEPARRQRCSAPGARASSAPCRPVRLPGERLPRCSTAGLSPEGPGGGLTSPSRRRPRLPFSLADLVGPLRRLPGAAAGATLPGWLQGNPGPPRLGQADGDGLLRRARSVLPVPDVVHLLVNELPGRGRRALSFPEVLPRLLHGSLLGHDESSSVPGGWESCFEVARVRRLEQSGPAPGRLLGDGERRGSGENRWRSMQRSRVGRPRGAWSPRGGLMALEYAFEMAASSIRFGRGVTREIGMDLAEMRGPEGDGPQRRPSREAAAGGHRPPEPPGQPRSRRCTLRSGPGRADRRVVPGGDRLRGRGPIRRLRRRRRRLEHRHGQGGQPVRHLSRGVPRPMSIRRSARGGRSPGG